MNSMTLSLALAAAALLAACASPPEQHVSRGHISAESAAAAPPPSIPQPVQQSAVLAPPRPAAKAETYSVVVNNVPVHELLFALARDAKLNVDVHGGIGGAVTLNAIDQTLPQLLSRIAKQVDMRYELDGPNLSVMPDTPFLRSYQVDYVNMSRSMVGAATITTQIPTTGGAGGGSGQGGPATGAGGQSAGSNTASTTLTTEAKNSLMDSLIKNVKDILAESDRVVTRALTTRALQSQADVNTQARGAGSSSISGPTSQPVVGGQPAPQASAAGTGNQSVSGSARGSLSESNALSEVREASFVIANYESGVLSVRATSKQHEKIQEFIDRVMTIAKRQVLIEATIVEVQLSENYQQGINWSRLRLDGTGFAFSQAPVGGIPSGVGQSLFSLTYTNPGSRLGNIAATVSLLESFGTVKVLSSPKLSVLNNQTAILKVVDNLVYFLVEASTVSTANVGSTTRFTSTPQSVAVGFVMNVTAQVGEGDEVVLNVRPTVSRVTTFVNDPNPSLAQFNTVNRVPQIQTRELESIIRVASGDVAVMGGLMQDSVNNSDDAVPGVSRAPGIGWLFSHKNDTNTKSELVVFLRPTVIKEASLAGDYQAFREQLPDNKFFANNPGPPRPVLDVWR